MSNIFTQKLEEKILKSIKGLKDFLLPLFPLIWEIYMIQWSVNNQQNSVREKEVSNESI